MVLIGRDDELEAVRDAFDRGARVVTVIGAPGTGKSALGGAYAAARKAARCDLSTARAVDHVGASVAHALGASLGAAEGEPAILEAIGRAIGLRGPLLLLLDDVDGVGATLAQALPGWIAAAPDACFLVTSRARLGVAFERCIELGPLVVPPPGEEDPAVIEATSAVRLFVDRAAASQPGYRLPRAEATTVAAIVRRLDGLPLAIELCASRVPVLGERALAELLADRFDVLEASEGRTLSRAIAWSWELLDDEGRASLARCSVFQGSFELAAAAAVGVGRSARQPKAAAAAELEKLAARSMIRASTPDGLPGERRYAMLGSVRAFAAERLAERAAEADEVALLHARHFARLDAAPPEERAIRLSLEREDLSAAFATAMKAADAELAARLVLRAEPLALARGPLAPFLASLDAALARPDLPPRFAAELRLARGLATLFRGQRDVASLEFEAARALAASGELVDVYVLATSKLGLIAGLKGNLAEARRLMAEASSAQGASPRARGILLKDLANVLSEAGANDEAMITLARARDLLHEAREVREEGFVAMLVGGRLLDEGRIADAQRDLEDALALLRRAGDRRSEAWTTVLMALTEIERGEHDAARARLEGAARAFRAIGDAHTEGLVHGYLGNVALERGLFGDAERAYRDARRMLEAAGDEGALAMALAAGAVAEARLGRAAAARDAIARASALSRKDGRAARAEAIALLASAVSIALGACDRSVAEGAASRPAPGDAEEVRFAKRVLAGAPAPSAGEAGALVARDGAWVRLPDGRRVDLARSRTLRAIVTRLVSERLGAPGRAVAPSVLVRSAWPGERILPAAAKNRLHVTITRLRRLGLGELIVHGAEGYLLDPAIDLRVDGEL